MERCRRSGEVVWWWGGEVEARMRGGFTETSRGGGVLVVEWRGGVGTSSRVKRFLLSSTNAWLKSFDFLPSVSSP